MGSEEEHIEGGSRFRQIDIPVSAMYALLRKMADLHVTQRSYIASFDPLRLCVHS